MNKIELRKSTKTSAELQQISETGLIEPDEKVFANPLDIIYHVEENAREERIKEEYSKIDPDGSTTWLLIKLFQYPSTKKFLFRILAFYNMNQTKFRLFLFSIFTFCSLLISLSLFGYYEQFHQVEFIFIAVFYNVLHVFRFIIFYFYKFEFDYKIEIIFSVYYFVVTTAILATKLYFKLIVFDCAYFLITFSCTTIVLLFNLLMSDILFKYFKYILPSVFFLSLLFFSVFYKFKYFLFVYIVCMILCTFCNFLFRVFFLRPPRYSDIIYAGIITFYVYTSDLVTEYELINNN
ncbi:hypothetical protein TUBRATIS_20000 [Tubulinosema ratisbonensis]|uniref:Uncharacterized protein n=1 Tax=Tubulinosema ratisbonensis TaxID=291195 RepID=A0A437AKE3_9MICR|nr:hypothetical protein TUBRATIS_20000 [Tubulinosema ratisbonensis]